MIVFWGVIVVVSLVVACTAVVARDWVEVIFPGIIIGCVAVALGEMLCIGIGSAFVGCHPETYNQPLAALTDERNITGGSFFLGTGSIGSSAAFTFYGVHDDGSRELYQQASDGVKVFEDSPLPYAVWENGQASNNATIVPCFEGGHHIPTLREIHVPPGSIKTGIVMGVKP